MEITNVAFTLSLDRTTGESPEWVKLLDGDDSIDQGQILAWMNLPTKILFFALMHTYPSDKRSRRIFGLS